MNKLLSFHLVSASAAAAMILPFGRLVEFTSAAPGQTAAIQATAPVVTDATPVKTEAGRSTRTHRASRGLPVNV